MSGARAERVTAGSFVSEEAVWVPVRPDEFEAVPLWPDDR
jgi:hypothetical protein